MRRIDCLQMVWLTILSISGALTGLAIDYIVFLGNSCKFQQESLSFLGYLSSKTIN